jgi:uncharacterized membrane protein YjgN (DUF898 family)
VICSELAFESPVLPEQRRGTIVLYIYFIFMIQCSLAFSTLMTHTSTLQQFSFCASAAAAVLSDNCNLASMHACSYCS